MKYPPSELKKIKVGPGIKRGIHDLAEAYSHLNYPEVSVLSAGKFSDIYSIYQISKKLKRKKNEEAKALGEEVMVITAAGLKKRGMAIPGGTASGRKFKNKRGILEQYSFIGNIKRLKALISEKKYEDAVREAKKIRDKDSAEELYKAGENCYNRNEFRNSAILFEGCFEIFSELKNYQRAIQSEVYEVKCKSKLGDSGPSERIEKLMEMLLKMDFKDVKDNFKYLKKSRNKEIESIYQICKTVAERQGKGESQNKKFGEILQKEYSDDAKKYEQNGEYGEAAESYVSIAVITEFEDRKKFYLKAAENYEKNGEYGKANMYYETVVDHYECKPAEKKKVFEKIAGNYEKMGLNKMACGYYEEAARLEQDTEKKKKLYLKVAENYEKEVEYDPLINMINLVYAYEEVIKLEKDKGMKEKYLGKIKDIHLKIAREHKEMGEAAKVFENYAAAAKLETDAEKKIGLYQKAAESLENIDKTKVNSGLIQDTIDGLIEGLKDEDEKISKGSSGALAKVGYPAVNDLINVLNDKDLVRAGAVEALVKIGSPALPALIEALKKGKGGYHTPSEIGKVLGKIKDPEVVPDLIEILESGTHGRMAGADALGEIGDIRAVDILLKISLSKEDVRWHAAKALGKMDYSKNKKVKEKVVGVLIDAMKNGTYEASQNAVRALQRVGLPAVPALIKTLKEENESVRKWTVEALGGVDYSKDKKTREKVVDVLTGDFKNDPEIRYWIVNALGEIKDPKTIPILIEALKEGYPTWNSAAESLIKIGAPAEGALINLLSGSRDKKIRERAENILRKIRGYY
ncbi:HEAT repeat domain-containing protein [Candidatus Micrarchaeota archaeon]|nr:HEAT repeat domain-containing protein [Candidatus Micrarchaeota archaeon]